MEFRNLYAKKSTLQTNNQASKLICILYATKKEYIHRSSLGSLPYGTSIENSVAQAYFGMQAERE
jgi:hypothetical protein